ncbi:MAG: MutS-related protein [Chitinophagaceae bacterium]
MQVDKTTIDDLSIFSREEEHSVFYLLDFTRTIGGRRWLRFFLNNPFDNLKQIEQTQQILQSIIEIHQQWPQTITNGTVMVIERFYDTELEDIPFPSNEVNSFVYKLIYVQDYLLVRFSVTHCIDFIKGLKEISQLLSKQNKAETLQPLIDRIDMLLNKDELQKMLRVDKSKKLSRINMLNFGHFLRYRFRNAIKELIEIYSKLDAYYSMATACKNHDFCFPQFAELSQPFLNATQLYHPLLPTPVAYDVDLNKQQNFLFLTGANMAGKSTFIKAVGVAVYLAHIGMGVPSKKMELSFFDGLLSNIQVVDNIIQGESYFYNEVQRIRKTIEKINDGKKWLILIDELFKGTNVQDAMKCSTVVIEGLHKMKNALFILSTHLYEIGENLKQYPNIQFRYFETEIKNDELLFNYQLKEGISNDRLGYLILKREGVVDLLKKM